MKLIIELVDNGFVLTRPGDTPEETVVTVFEDRDSLEHYRDLCYHILEAIGYIGSKHDSERLFIEIKKQGG